MKRKLGYSFDDEVAIKFCYDIDNKIIEIHFSGYFDTIKNQHVDKPCVWIINDWKSAKSKLTSEISFSDLERHLGIISMILSAEMDGNVLEISANTTDNRYIDLLFDNSQLTINIK